MLVEWASRHVYMDGRATREPKDQFRFRVESDVEQALFNEIQQLASGPT